MDFVYFYLAIGLLLNVGLSLTNFYRASDRGYVVLPHPMIFFLTIFSWPKTLWDLIASFGKDEEDGD